LDLPRDYQRLHPVFHSSLLRHYYDDPSRPKIDRPPPQLDDHGDEYYNVERIVDHTARLSNGTKGDFYLVKWEGYPDTDNTWEPRDTFLRTPELRRMLQEFHRKR
jgi:hypothetical protein